MTCLKPIIMTTLPRHHGIAVKIQKKRHLVAIWWSVFTMYDHDKIIFAHFCYFFTPPASKSIRQFI